MANENWPVYGEITGPVVMIGFGSIGRGTLPLIERHFAQVVARTGQVSVTDDEDQAAHAEGRSTGYEPVPNEAGDASDD